MRNNVARAPAAHSRRRRPAFGHIFRPRPVIPALWRVRHPLLSATNLAARDRLLSPICRPLLAKGMIQQLNTKMTCRDPRILSLSLSLYLRHFLPKLQSSRRAEKQSTTCIQLAYPCHCAPRARLDFRFAFCARKRASTASAARFEENGAHRFGSLWESAAKYRIRF